jgi:hypothetical protein
MTIAVAITETTCGEACWSAREDICRCSCIGKNHGVTRTPAGVTPVRTRKLNGHAYQLLAVESTNGSCRAVRMRPLEVQKSGIMGKLVAGGRWERYSWDSTPGYPVKLKTASESEVRRWPELAAWRGHGRPCTSWIRADLADVAGV